MVAALPVRERDDSLWRTLGDVWYDRTGRAFDANPGYPLTSFTSFKERGYMDELKMAKRRGTLAVVKAILKRRGCKGVE